MNNLKITVDFNGIVVFDPERLKKYFGGSIKYSENIYRKMTTTSAGDEVIQQGILIPILGINDSTYNFSIRKNTEHSNIRSEIVLSNGTFPLKVESRLVVADLACFLEWEDELSWHPLDVRPGIYSATIHGFRAIKNNKVIDFGFEIVLSEEDELPILTGDVNASMQVLELP